MAIQEDLARALRGLLAVQRIAVLGTLHRGEPCVSMVPFALVADPACFVIHVSALAAHTADMRADPRVSLLVVAPPQEGTAPQATARITVQGVAAPCPPSDARHEAARAAYLARFPEGAPMFDFADFSLYLIEPASARYVGGFAQARTVGAASLAEALRTAR